MAYSDFSLTSACEKFALNLREEDDLFIGARDVPVSQTLQSLLDQHVPLAVAINTEKARDDRSEALQ